MGYDVLTFLWWLLAAAIIGLVLADAGWGVVTDLLADLLLTDAGWGRDAIGREIA